jgi:hypothetical protein
MHSGIQIGTGGTQTTNKWAEARSGKLSSGDHVCLSNLISLVCSFGKGMRYYTHAIARCEKFKRSGTNFDVHMPQPALGSPSEPQGRVLGAQSVFQLFK